MAKGIVNNQDGKVVALKQCHSQHFAGVLLLYSSTNVTDDNIIEGLCILTNLWFSSSAHSDFDVSRWTYLNSIPLDKLQPPFFSNKTCVSQERQRETRDVRTRVTPTTIAFDAKVSGNGIISRNSIINSAKSMFDTGRIEVILKHEHRLLINES